MEFSVVIGYAVVFFAGLIVGRVWGRASARQEGNMLLPRPAVAAVQAQAAAYALPDALLEEEVRRLAADGKLINAIKLYRERTGCSLKDAKDAVERIRG